MSEQYGSVIKPSFDLDPEMATRLEGLLSGAAISGQVRKSASFSSAELSKLSQVAFNQVEITSFMMSAIAIMDEGLHKLESDSKGTLLSTVQEHRPFLGSMDKACRHLVRESLALIATFMARQRSILGASIAAGVPNIYKHRLLKAPLARFEVAPNDVMEDVKRQFDAFIQNKAFSTAVAKLGNVNKFKSSKKTVRKMTVLSRGGNRGLSFRGIAAARGNRGNNRGALRGVRKASGLSKNARGYMRRDRALREADPRVFASTSTAGFSAENRQ